MRVHHHFFTSASRGTSAFAGFQTVAASEALSAAAIRKLESLSVYSRPRDRSRDDGGWPVSLNFYLLNADQACLSQIIYAGRDFSGRPGNYFAHNIVVSIQEFLREANANAFCLFDHPRLFRKTFREAEVLSLDDKVEVCGIEDFSGLEWLSHQPKDLVRNLVGAAFSATIGGPRVFVVPPSEDERATVFKSLALLLPRMLRTRFAFSTYRSQSFPSEMVAFGVWESQELERLAHERRGYLCDFRLATTTPADVLAAIFAYADFVLDRVYARAFNQIAELQYQISLSEVETGEDLAVEISMLL